MQRTTTNPAQLAFDGLLAYAEEANELRIFERATAHLPGNWTDALPFYRSLLELHHAAMLDANEEEVIRLRGDAQWLAEKLNGCRAALNSRICDLMFSTPILTIAVKSRIHVVKSKTNLRPNFVRDFNASPNACAHLTLT